MTADPIVVEVMGARLEVLEPTGEAALALYSGAIGVCTRAGVLDAFVRAELAQLGAQVERARLEELGDDADPEAVRQATEAYEAARTQAGAAALRHYGAAAVQLAGTDGALAVVRRTLVGGTLDGAPITERDFARMFAHPGRYLLPYVAALVAWMRAGFFSGPGELPTPGRAAGASAPTGLA